MFVSAADAFMAFTTQFEGRVPWMYVDIKGLVTVGVGNLIDPKPAALGLPFVDRWTGEAAAADAISSEWDLLKGRKDELARQGHRACEPITSLRLGEADIDALVMGKVQSNESVLKASFPVFDSWPADAQLGLHSMAWALGPVFSPRWPRFTAAALAGDFEGAAAECRMREEGNPGVVPRNDANELLFRNAAAVVAQGGDRETLHYPGTFAPEPDGDGDGGSGYLDPLWPEDDGF